MSKRKPMKWRSLRGQCVQIENDQSPRSGTVSADPRQSKRLVRMVGGQARDPKRVRGKWTVKPGTDAAMPAAPGGNMMPRGPILTGSALDSSIGDGRANAISALVGGEL